MDFILPKIITWDYQFVPNAQKSRNLLNACQLPYRCCEQPFTRPRPALTDLGITYRRIPVNSIGKDFYCDNKIFFDAIQSIFPDKFPPTSSSDAAYEALGYRAFWIAFKLIPASMITPEVVKDREGLFDIPSNFADLRPNVLAEFKSLLNMIEHEVLISEKGPWIHGELCGVADLHLIWIVKWAFQTLGIGMEKGFDRTRFPKVHRWMEGLPSHDEANLPDTITAEEAREQVFKYEYAAKEIGIDEEDATGLKYGTIVKVTTTDDARPGANFQVGKLIGLGSRETVIELANSLRIHFPRIGYAVDRCEYS